MKYINKKIFFVLIGLVILAVFGFALLKIAKATTNIGPPNASSTNIWAWNDAIGWIDFYSPNTVNVTNSVIHGYASSTAGWVSLDCNTSPAGPICSSQNGYYAVDNDGAGHLAGWAWNDNYGWISFCGNATSASVWNGSSWACPSPGGADSYQVDIDALGNFQGWAWNDTVGWISFNYNNTNETLYPYWVQTAWAVTSTQGVITSSVFDTGVANGAQFNSAMWLGNESGGGNVLFEIAVSNSTSGPWNYVGPYEKANGTPITLPYNLIGRYFRYRLTLISNYTYSPTVSNIIVNWSP
ncbi:MAG: hypothetical protein M1334_01585 [Patescibacteria group bacterium]|nr:hypothetical protein [Patescibacteria group bacterium]